VKPSLRRVRLEEGAIHAAAGETSAANPQDTHAKRKNVSRFGSCSAISSNMKFSLKDRWVLITGASSGFGAAAARAFGAEGSKLLLGARRMDRLEQVAAEARQAGAVEAQFHPLDVSKTASVEAFGAWAQDRIGRQKSEVRGLHVLINNAGGAHGLETVAEGKDEDWETMLQTNVLGVLRMTRAVLPLIPHDAGATIINIGSIAGHVAYEGGSAYCAAKAGELQITRTLRLELCGTGIRVCTVDPGLAETEFSLVRFKGDGERAKKSYAGTHPLLGKDIAEALVWVASRPPHVNIDEMIIKPTDQAALHKVYRRNVSP
jgi:3-hydroxy acid dehydrogenase / malonic semialdehyde reductase